jgi:hypothetical protein
MAADPFNILGGLTVGIPAVNVVDANGNVVSNVFTTGNVTANVIYSDNYKLANGAPLQIGASGSNTQVQYNANGVFGASSSFTFDSNVQLVTATNIAVPGNITLSDVANVTILGGVNGYFLQTDGSGNLAWAAGGGGGNGSPGGSNTQVQYNDGGLFGGTSTFTFSSVTNTLSVSTANVTDLNATGNITGGTLYANAAGLYNIPSANISGSVAVANTVSNNAQPNITSVGTLTTLAVTGNITSGAAVVGNAITTNGIMQIGSGGNLVSLGNVNFNSVPVVTLGAVGNIKITGGTAGYVLGTDGLGNLSWVAGGGSGNGSPGGSNTQVQFNSAGSFGGSPYFTFNTTTNTLTIAGDLVANSLTLGAGVYKFNRSNVYFATTSSLANVALVAIPASNISSVDFTVIATDDIAAKRQVSKLSAVLYQSSLNYSEYSTLFVNGLTGNFTMAYNPGNILSPPTATLYVEPTSTNMTVYKVMVTVYEP